MLKLLIHQESHAILGVHIIGTGATELIHIGQCAIAFKATVEYFVNAVFNYPTLAECYKVAASTGSTSCGACPMTCEAALARRLTVTTGSCSSRKSVPGRGRPASRSARTDSSSRCCRA
jgi:hypothetical protein